jgi:5-formyltetrahydrofolate cyclo-ligase
MADVGANPKIARGDLANGAGGRGSANLPSYSSAPAQASVTGQPNQRNAQEWRARIRRDLIDRRLAANPDQRALWSAAINDHLTQAWPEPPGRTIAFCWPFKAEHDVRRIVRQWIAKGAQAALPVVVAPKSPLIFRRWHEGVRMESGPLGIPFPVDSEVVQPDTILLPANGFDALGFRLGYGAGFFDRTIAGLIPRPRIIGIAYEIGRLDSIQPQRHDEPMHFVVTEAGVQVCGATDPARRNLDDIARA